MDWRKRGPDPVELAALHPGVPAWMQRQLLISATAFTTEEYDDEWSNPHKRPDELMSRRIVDVAGSEIMVALYDQIEHGVGNADSVRDLGRK